jgi:cell division protein FtsB
MRLRRRGAGAERGGSATRSPRAKPATPTTFARLAGAGVGVRRFAGRFARRAAWPLLFAVVLCGVLFLGVFPTRTYLQKKNEIASAEQHLAQITDANDQVQGHVDQLKTDAEIERLAREQYGVVRRGEEAYHVLPPPKDPIQIPDVWPFNRIKKHAEK